jgi:hypothetical protein
MSKDFSIGDQVRYIPGFKGYFAAEVVGFDGLRLVIEFSSGMQITCWEDELEEA